ncbi:FadR/GntR family transcriptional regulator [Chitinophaga parva]|nr:FadR/GntR family transcriptional regulator [Chitinophaga parva]
MQSSDDMMNNAVIKKRSLADEVASALQEQIAKGVYKIGDKLPIEPELMKQYGVGRSTIREAIKTLVNAGLLRVQQGLGTFVESMHVHAAPIDQRLKRANLHDLNEVRQLLEMKIAEKAARYRTAEDISAMQACLDRRLAAANAGQLEQTIDADIAFHTAIATAARNEILSDLYQAVSVHLKKGFAKLYNDTGIFLRSHALHVQLCQAIADQDQKKAWNTVGAIIDNTDK